MELEKVYTNLLKVYTKKGDFGETGLFGGTRVSKTDIKVDTYGNIDEASSFIGVARAIIEDEEIKNTLYKIQEKFIVIGGYLSSDRNGILKLKEKISDEDVEELERGIDYFSRDLLPLNKFIIPGENIQSSALHVARTVVRRSERKLIYLKERRDISKEILKYINRTSDLLFILARVTEGQEAITYISNNVMKKINKLSFETDLTLNNKKRCEKIETKGKLTLEKAKKIVAIGQNKAVEMGKDFVFAVVNSEGNLILEEKMDGAILASIEIALKKAYTSAALKLDTSVLADMVVPGGTLYGLHTNSKYVVFGGGVVLKNAIGEIVGALGVSGGTVEEDMTIANICVESF